MVSHRGVLDAADIVQPGVFRADAGVAETGGNRVGVDDLAIVVLQQEGTVAVQLSPGTPLLRLAACLPVSMPAV